MKTLTFLVCMLTSAVTCNAQLSVGNTWNYNYYYYISSPNAIHKVASMEVAKDTVVAGYGCLKLTQTEGTPCTTISSNIIREEQNRIYYWRSSSSSFELLYDFNLNDGESYVMRTDNDSSVITIDSTSTLNFNGNDLKVQYISSENDIVEIYGATVQGIGNLRFFFPGHGTCDPFHYDGVRCFTNDDGTLYFNVSDCEVISGITKINMNEVQIYPNPTIDFITISNYFESDMVLYEIIDLRGKVILSSTNTEASNQFDVGSLQKGYYFVKTTNTKTNAVVTKQFVKA